MKSSALVKGKRKVVKKGVKRNQLSKTRKWKSKVHLEHQQASP